MPGHPMLRSWGLNLSSPVFSSEDPQKLTPGTNTLQHASFVPETSALSKFFFSVDLKDGLASPESLEGFYKETVYLLCAIVDFAAVAVVVAVGGGGGGGGNGCVAIVCLFYFFGIDVKVMQDIREMEFCQK